MWLTSIINTLLTRLSYNLQHSREPTLDAHRRSAWVCHKSVASNAKRVRSLLMPRGSMWVVKVITIETLKELKILLNLNIIWIHSANYELALQCSSLSLVLANIQNDPLTWNETSTARLLSCFLLVTSIQSLYRKCFFIYSLKSKFIPQTQSKLSSDIRWELLRVSGN